MGLGLWLVVALGRAFGLAWEGDWGLGLGRGWSGGWPKGKRYVLG